MSKRPIRAITAVLSAGSAVATGAYAYTPADLEEGRKGDGTGARWAPDLSAIGRSGARGATGPGGAARGGVAAAGAPAAAANGRGAAPANTPPAVTPSLPPPLPAQTAAPTPQQLQQLQLYRDKLTSQELSDLLSYPASLR